MSLSILIFFRKQQFSIAQLINLNKYQGLRESEKREQSQENEMRKKVIIEKESAIENNYTHIKEKIELREKKREESREKKLKILDESDFFLHWEKYEKLDGKNGFL